MVGVVLCREAVAITSAGDVPVAAQSGFAVAKSHRRRGIGLELLKMSNLACQRSGLVAVVGWPENRTLDVHAGFRPAGSFCDVVLDSVLPTDHSVARRYLRLYELEHDIALPNLHQYRNRDTWHLSRQNHDWFRMFNDYSESGRYKYFIAELGQGGSAHAVLSACRTDGDPDWQILELKGSSADARSDLLASLVTQVGVTRARQQSLADLPTFGVLDVVSVRHLYVNSLAPDGDILFAHDPQIEYF
ncbi:hypothetical protein GCM10027404_32470 [Arthrobacter tumbae]|nr:GNAT family N-acetyltransferase [Arthrobacter tumbae]MBM7781851.1 hypothetical protein [Arthrobacter tumbae]